MKQFLMKIGAKATNILLAALFVSASVGAAEVRAEELKYVDANGITFAYLEGR